MLATRTDSGKRAELGADGGGPGETELFSYRSRIPARRTEQKTQYACWRTFYRPAQKHVWGEDGVG